MSYELGLNVLDTNGNRRANMRGILLAAVLMAMVMLLVFASACSGDDNEASAPLAQASAPAAQAPPDPGSLPINSGRSWARSV